MKRLTFFFALAALLFHVTVHAAAKPNIIYILSDDLGYGDLSCLNPQSKIKTPHADRLAREGMIFTDAHSGSAVCTPTRYGIITGRYAWRSKLKNGVLGGLSPRLIEPGRETVASFLKSQGYATACIGKWHMGMDWTLKPGKEVSELNIEKPEQVWNVDYTQPIKNGPNSVGFDYYYGISASLDMVPYTYIENDKVTVNPTEEKQFAMYLGKDGGNTRKGPTAPGFDAANVLPDFAKKATSYIAQQAKAAKDGKPFFLYLPLASPHTPILPTKEWQDKSGVSAYADFVLQNDWALGQVMEALEKNGLAENTLLIFTSDNGCSNQADYPDLLAKGHNPSHIFRGHKADIFEGGHHIPFIARWPAKVKADSTYDHTICLTDLFATVAAITDQKLPDTAAEDSVSLLPAFTGKTKTALREATVHHSINGSFAIRQGEWKLCLTPDSGGWSAPRPGRDDASALPLIQLYNLTSDIGEQKNVQAENPEVVSKLTKLLEKYVAEGRSTPGKPQANNGEVTIQKKVTPVPAAKKKK
ncbi:MAG TPA: arylsulfatase [Verrucomicrobiae bacterium]